MCRVTGQPDEEVVPQSYHRERMCSVVRYTSQAPHTRLLYTKVRNDFIIYNQQPRFQPREK